MALTVNSQSQPYQATQVYQVTGNVGDTVTAVIDDTSVAYVVPNSAVLGASGFTFTAYRNTSSGGATTLTFKDTTTLETVPVTLNLAGDLVAFPEPVTGLAGTTVTLQVLEQNDPDAFASITVEDTTIATISITSNAAGSALVAVTLVANGTTNIDVDDGHGGTLTVPVLVGLGAPTKNVTVSALEAVIGGTLVTMPQTVVPLADTTSNFNGPGGYTISLTSDKKYVVTYGIAPAESTTQINIGSAVLKADGTTYLADKRTLHVSNSSVNTVIAHEPFSDGTPVTDAIISPRNLFAALLGMFHTAGTGPTEPTGPVTANGTGTGGPVEGQLFYNTTTNVFEIFQNGSWHTISVVGSLGVSSLDGKTGSLSIIGGTNVTVDDSVPNQIKINSTASGGVTSLDSKTGAISIIGGTNVTIDDSVAGQIKINASGGSSGVTSLDSKTGSITIVGGTNTTIDDSVAGQIKINGPSDSHIAAQAPVQSVSAGTGLTNGGTSTNPILNVTSGSIGTLSLNTLQVNDGAAHIWKLNETSGTTATDSVGANNGTYTGSYTLNVLNIATNDQNTSARFNRSGTAVTTTIADPNTSAFSIEAVVQLTPTASQFSRVCGNSRTFGTLKGFELILGWGQVQFSVGNGSTDISAGQNPTNPLPEFKVYHIVGVFNGSLVKCYLNGSLVASTSFTGSYSSPGTNFQIGSVSGGGLTENFNGNIQQVALYATALTEATIANHYVAIR